MDDIIKEVKYNNFYMPYNLGDGVWRHAYVVIEEDITLQECIDKAIGVDSFTED